MANDILNAYLQPMMMLAALAGPQRRERPPGLGEGMGSSTFLNPYHMPPTGIDLDDPNYIDRVQLGIGDSGGASAAPSLPTFGQDDPNYMDKLLSGAFAEDRPAMQVPQLASAPAPQPQRSPAASPPPLPAPTPGPEAQRPASPPAASGVNNLRASIHGQRQAPSSVVVHWTGGNENASPEDLLAGWRDSQFGYHYAVGPDGTVHNFADPTEVVWHTRGDNIRDPRFSNSNSVGISYLSPGVDEQGNPIPPTPEAQEAINRIIRELVARYGISPELITGQGAVSPHKHPEEGMLAARAAIQALTGGRDLLDLFTGNL